MRNVDVSSGIRKPAICGGRDSVSRVAVIIAGNEAKDERPLNAIACAGNAARANTDSEIRPPIAATGYSSAMSTANRTHDTPMYVTSAPAALTPIRAANGTASANTPSGASRNTQRTSVIDPSRMPSNTRITAARRAMSIRVRAIANATEKRISGNIAPSTAALMGLAGTRSITHCASVGIFAAPSVAALTALAAPTRSASVVFWSICTMDSIGPAASTPSATEHETAVIISNNARPPKRPMVRVSGAAVTPTIKLETTSGIIVIRMALMNSVPIGSMPCVNAVSVVLSLTETPTPNASPAIRATSTCAVGDMMPRYGVDRATAMLWVLAVDQRGHQGLVGRQIMCRQPSEEGLVRILHRDDHPLGQPPPLRRQSHRNGAAV